MKPSAWPISWTSAERKQRAPAVMPFVGSKSQRRFELTVIVACGAGRAGAGERRLDLAVGEEDLARRRDRRARGVETDGDRRRREEGREDVVGVLPRVEVGAEVGVVGDPSDGAGGHRGAGERTPLDGDRDRAGGVDAAEEALVVLLAGGDGGGGAGGGLERVKTRSKLVSGLEPLWGSGWRYPAARLACSRARESAIACWKVASSTESAPATQPSFQMRKVVLGAWPWSRTWGGSGSRKVRWCDWARAGVVRRVRRSGVGRRRRGFMTRFRGD